MSPWLDPAQDEVLAFHPAFESAANDVLTQLGLDQTYHWVHHPQSASDNTVPDFVLADTGTSEWVLIFEIKRTRGAVFSGRFQAQAKGYADNNQQRFRVGHPVYFAISNLEVTVLCALNGARPASECVVVGGVTNSGDFTKDEMAVHLPTFKAHLEAMVSRVVNTSTETFEYIWPPIVEEWLQHTRALAQHSPSGPPEPTSPGWIEVSRYFGQPSALSAARVTLLQALLTDFLRGRLTATEHSDANRVPPAASTDQTARAIDALRRIDFDAIFDRDAGNRLRNSESGERASLDDYIAVLAARNPGLFDLARTRQDYLELIEETLLSIYPLDDQAGAGKVQTDPELADVLASLAVANSTDIVLDPCCGDGPLLVAAMDRLGRIGVPPAQALSQIYGIEADPIACRLAGSRLALRATSVLSQSAQPKVAHGDMFASEPSFAAATTVLMNPPFRRYEDQGTPPPPAALINHYRASIQATAGVSPRTLDGQANLFHYYLEYVTQAIQPGTRVGLILDNKWFQNATGRNLRAYVLDHYMIEALVEYPHRSFFASWDIATTLLIGVRENSPSASHRVRFVRALTDPRHADLSVLANAMYARGPWPSDWRVQTVPQGSLGSEEGWKQHFASPVPVDLASIGLVPLDSLFARSRRGSLQKEGGGTHVFAFPFSITRFPERRSIGNGRPFNTKVTRVLTPEENAILRDAAQAIPNEFRGYGLRRADIPDSYELTQLQVEREQTLEPPKLRSKPELFLGSRRSTWTQDHMDAVAEIRGSRDAGAYLEAVEQIVNLTDAVLPDAERFVDLREPYAGELVIPRKMRNGHRVHVNPLAFRSGRQLRISTNFVTYGGCLATDAELDRATASRLIAAFLVSSFGHLQFEETGVNREGLLAIEKGGMDSLLVLDPRQIDAPLRIRILEEFTRLPFPVPTTILASDQARVGLDRLFAEVLAPRCNLTVDRLLQVVHDAIDEWIIARQP